MRKLKMIFPKGYTLCRCLVTGIEWGKKKWKKFYLHRNP